MQKHVADASQFREVSGRNRAELWASTENSSLAICHEFSGGAVAEATEILRLNSEGKGNGLDKYNLRGD